MEKYLKHAADADALLGNYARAVLVFPDAPPKSYEEEEVKSRSAIGALEARGNAAANAASKVGKLVSALNGAGSFVGNLSMDAKIAEIGGKALKVQFNPATLQINARGGGRQPITNYGKAGSNQAGTIQYGALDPYIEVHFNLIFDKTNIADAFFADKFAVSATSIAKNGATAAVNLLDNQQFTVRPFVEGFLAAVRHENFRTVVFLWGEMRYEGIMNTAQCKYTMFSPSGNPIRAEVGVTILAASAKAPQEGTPPMRDYTSYWKNRYKTIIQKNSKKDASGSYISAVKDSNQMNNLFNL